MPEKKTAQKKEELKETTHSPEEHLLQPTDEPPKEAGKNTVSLHQQPEKKRTEQRKKKETADAQREDPPEEITGKEQDSSQQAGAGKTRAGPSPRKTEEPKGSLLDKIKEAKAQSKERKFVQSWELAINVKGLDLKRPENRLNLECLLPEGRGRPLKVGIFADALLTEAKKYADAVITKEEIAGLAKNKKKLKQLANEIDWFFGEAPLMALVGKSLGTVLGPRGKVPKPLPPQARLEPIIARARASVRVVLRDNPVIHVAIGTTGMADSQIVANAEAVLYFVKEKLPKGRDSVRSVYLKLTMGKPVRVE